MPTAVGIRRLILKEGPSIMTPRLISSMLAVAAIAMALGTTPASAHCDTINGPVVSAAKLALEKGDVTPVLKWVKPGAEAEIRSAFEQTMAVRRAGPQARELADRYFFETLVRIHRAGEGAPYTGLKSADTPVEPAVRAADQALDGSTSIDAVVKVVTGDIATGIRQRWLRAAEAKKHADDSVEAGREYVEAYVDYVHYVENVHAAASAGRSEHAGEATHAAPHVHK
jgi:hypothetical protein